LVEGLENLDAPTTIEREVALRRGFAAEERLACLSTVRGDCVVTTSYW
jgi:ferredoxin